VGNRISWQGLKPHSMVDGGKICQIGTIDESLRR
jgi:hypothetical protein